MKILYVEDNPANVFLVKRVAKMGQHEIINFIDGREAIRKYDDVDPDLVLMDIQLVGETSGLEVVKELRGRGVTTPIIAVTAYAMVGDKERCMQAGCNDYLAKPLPIPRLIEIFQTYDAKAKEIRATQARPAVQEPAPPPPVETTTPASEAPPTASDEKVAESVVAQAESIKEAPAEAPATASDEKVAEPIVAQSEPVAQADSIKEAPVEATPAAQAVTPTENEATDVQEPAATAPLAQAETTAANDVVDANAEATATDNEPDDSTLPAKPEEVAQNEGAPVDKVEPSKTEAK